MIKLKSIIEPNFSLTLYEFNDGTFSVVKTKDNLEIPSLPSRDLNMALEIFNLWYFELKKVN
jgi:hypothetical protein